MAIYRLSAQIISRGSGRSATAAAAYRSGSCIADQQASHVYDYERRSGVVHTEIMAPGGAPEWMLNREALWNAVERAERRKDAQLARELQLALPHEIKREAQLELLRSFVIEHFVSHGMIADVAVHVSHKKGDSRNDHAHVMLTTREIAGEGFGNKCRAWNERALLAQWRAAWANQVNTSLEQAGSSDRVDHRTLVNQRIDVEIQVAAARAANENEMAHALELEVVLLSREPEPKIGHIAYALERRGVLTERGDRWRRVVARNLQRMQTWVQDRQRKLTGSWKRFVTAAKAEQSFSPDLPSEATTAPSSTPETAELRRGRAALSLRSRKRIPPKPLKNRSGPPKPRL